MKLLYTIMFVHQKYIEMITSLSLKYQNRCGTELVFCGHLGRYLLQLQTNVTEWRRWVHGAVEV